MSLLSEHLEALPKLEAAHLALGQDLLHADEGRLYEVDLVVLAVLQRSLSLIDGFKTLFERQNYRLCASLIRMQLDSAMRLYAVSLVEKRGDLVMQLLEGKPLHHLKSRSGEKLTDKYLHQQLSQRFPFVTKVYELTSGYVHLSNPHMLACLNPKGEGKYELEMVLCKPLGNLWSEEEETKLVQTFRAATVATLDLCQTWVNEKRELHPRLSQG